MDSIKNTARNVYDTVTHSFSEHSGQHAGATRSSNPSTHYRMSEKQAHAPVSHLDVRTGIESHLTSRGHTTCPCNGNSGTCSCPADTCACAGCKSKRGHAGPMKGMGVKPIESGEGKMGGMGGPGGCRVLGRGGCECEPGTCEKGVLDARGQGSGMKMGMAGPEGESGLFGAMSAKGKASAKGVSGGTGRSGGSMQNRD